MIATHLSNTLERGTRRLLVLWAYVRDDLSATFEVFEQGQQVDQELYGQGQSQSQVISTDVFKVRRECGGFLLLLTIAVGLIITHQFFGGIV